jgi:polar amino acid transport system substrate-binding protein
MNLMICKPLRDMRRTKASRLRVTGALLRATSAIILLLASFSIIAPAQEAPKLPANLRVTTRQITPFVMKDQGKLKGFSIDLWHSIAAELNVKYDISEQQTLPELLTTVRSGNADLAIAAISVTAQREQEFDFSYPIFESGMQILVPSQASNSFALAPLLSFVLSRTFLQIMGILLFLTVVPAHLVWWFERHREDSPVSMQSYYPGIFHASWWAAGIIGAQIDEMPRSPLGRILAIICMFISALFFAYFTASVTASMTIQQLRGEITGPKDLPGKRVATILGSTSATYLRQQNIQIAEFTQISDAYKALADKKVNAVVYDSPILLYYASHEGKGKADVVGPVFRNESYAILFPQNSSLRKPVNAALLTLKENGTYEALYQKWFGTEAPRSP